MNPPDYDFLRDAGRILNSGQARTVVLTGSIHDLFFLAAGPDDGEAVGGRYVPLLQYLTAHWDLPDRILAVYELNGPIRFLHKEGREKVKNAWLKLRTGLGADQLAIEEMLSAGKMQAELAAMSGEFDANMHKAIGNPTLALELMRQMCLASRTRLGGEPLLKENLILLVEAADMLIPNTPITQMHDRDRHRVAICRDWFSDPGFMDNDDAVILLAESRSMLNDLVSRLPQVLDVPVVSNDEPIRRHFIEWFDDGQQAERKVRFGGSRDDLVRLTAGLSIHALRQLLKGASHEHRPLAAADVVAKVEAYIKSQLGEDIIEFKKPKHTLQDVVGFAQIKDFIQQALIPRFRSTGADALPGAAVAGPIGGGKTFLFEAVAAELDMVVLVLKNIRSQWFGQTDVIFERLRRVLDSLSKVLIFIDEADTQFGRVDAQAHATERRLTGKIQAMMSDPQLRGRVIWLLMTARIELLSPDIRRPGRTGDLIIPILDPEGDDREAFLRWVAQAVLGPEPSDEVLKGLNRATSGYSAASFASLRSELLAEAAGGPLTDEQVVQVAHDLLPPDIGTTRRYQTLQALLNCTRRCLLPNPDHAERDRTVWRDEARQLEREGLS